MTKPIECDFNNFIEEMYISNVDTNKQIIIPNNIYDYFDFLKNKDNQFYQLSFGLQTSTNLTEKAEMLKYNFGNKVTLQETITDKSLSILPYLHEINPYSRQKIFISFTTINKKYPLDMDLIFNFIKNICLFNKFNEINNLLMNTHSNNIIQTINNMENINQLINNYKDKSNVIFIEQLTDESHCEDCGYHESLGYNAILKINENTIIELSIPAIAHCFDNNDANLTDIFFYLFLLLGKYKENKTKIIEYDKPKSFFEFEVQYDKNID